MDPPIPPQIFQALRALYAKESHRLVIYLTGAGANSIGQLLSVPGGSSTILECRVPYASVCTQALLRSTNTTTTTTTSNSSFSFASDHVAGELAKSAYQRANAILLASAQEEEEEEEGNDILFRNKLLKANLKVIGIGCSGALTSLTPRRGEHRCHVSSFDGTKLTLYSAIIHKGILDRYEEDMVSSELILTAIFDTCPDIPFALKVNKTHGYISKFLQSTKFEILEHEHREFERILRSDAGADQSILFLPSSSSSSSSFLQTEEHKDQNLMTIFNPDFYSLLMGPHRLLDTKRKHSMMILPGSFNPLHEGHIQLARVCKIRFGGDVIFELSVTNADKPTLSKEQLEERLKQFKQFPVILTRCPFFVLKAEIMQGCSFIVGVDTAVRIVNPKYYNNSMETMVESLVQMAAKGCRFIVAGRLDPKTNRFIKAQEFEIPIGLSFMFTFLNEEDYRMDISSTELREKKKKNLS